ncbi:MAG: hypothetical protein JWN01_960 [Patescibacteria group bacterium]|jgi:hypothetical protein|nr:hypothetical protein [Patescibacteria group bacterium]
MQKRNPSDYDSFFMELPQADYLNDIEIQDEYEDTPEGKLPGLSDEQVSEIARDSLNAVGEQPSPSPEPDLFSQEDD